jgi:hypothetical protein
VAKGSQGDESVKVVVITEGKQIKGGVIKPTESTTPRPKPPGGQKPK